jgi:hypothetical protein
LEPVVLFFLLGLFAGFVKSDLKVPAALYDALSIFLPLPNFEWVMRFSKGFTAHRPC